MGKQTDRDELRPCISGDRALTDPASDRLGYAPFAERLADAILNLPHDEGVVIALHGAWGSGKTTALNFVCHFIAARPTNERPDVIEFNPWWFAGIEDLVRAFFDQLQAQLGPTKRLLNNLRSSLAGLAEAVSEAPTPYGSVGKVAARAARPRHKNVPELKQQIASVLRKRGKRILVVIDDIDRLSRDEIREVFRAIKAVADFPNIAYLLAFDRKIAVEALEGLYPGAGNDYLEKIVQVPFELPPADRLAIRGLFLERLVPILSDAKLDKTYFSNVFYESISKFLETPRDVARLTNALAVTFRAVAGEVNPVDFVAIESLRLFCPEAYDIVRSNQEMFAGDSPTDWRRPTREELKEFHDEWIKPLASSNPDHAELVRAMLKRLFPRFNSVWENIQYGPNWESRWRRELRICSEDIFPVYFSLAVPRGELSNSEIKSILEEARDAARLSERLCRLAEEMRPDGKTRLSAFLDRLQDYTESGVPSENIEPIVSALFDVGDKLVAPGELSGVGIFTVGDNFLMGQVIWQLLKRVEGEARFRILERTFAVGKAIYIMQEAVVVLGQQQGRYTDHEADPEQQWLVSGEQLITLESLLLQKIKSASQDSSLLHCPGLPWVLRFWQKESGEEEVGNWVSETTKLDANLALFLESHLSSASSLPLGDAVGKTHARLDPEWVRPFVDPDAIVDRVRRLVRSNSISARQKLALNQFLKEYDFRKAGGNPNSPMGFADLTEDDV